MCGIYIFYNVNKFDAGLIGSLQDDCGQFLFNCLLINQFCIQWGGGGGGLPSPNNPAKYQN